MEAVAARHAARLETENLARHDLFAVQHHDPVHGPHEFGVAGAPAHAPRDRQLVERRLHDAGQQCGGFRAGARRLAEQELAFRFRHARERGHGDAAGFRECGRRPRRLAARIEGGRHRRPAALDLLFGLFAGEPAHEHGETARRRVGERGAVREMRGIESCGDAVAESFREREQALRRQFFRADLDEEIGRLHLRRPEGTVPFFTL